MNINSKLASVAVVSAIAGATFLGANTASAQATGESLVSRIAERFSVSETEVQEVLDEYKADKQEEREAARDEHLTELVTDGVLTEEQRAELEAFGEEKRTLKEELRDQDLSREEIREAMEGIRDEIEAWAEAEGIDLDDIRPDDKKDRFERRGERRGELKELFHDEFGEHEDDAEDDELEADDVEDEDDIEDADDVEESAS